MELIVRRAFTFVQLRTILEENHHPFLIVEHNPKLYERARDMAGRVAQAMLSCLKGGDHPALRARIGPAPGNHGRARRPGFLLL